jgi:hypothetical protein
MYAVLLTQAATVEERRLSAALEAEMIRGFSPSPYGRKKALYKNTFNPRTHSRSGTPETGFRRHGPPNRATLNRI